jgi:uncharacterized protein (TIGR02246 family)
MSALIHLKHIAIGIGAALLLVACSQSNGDDEASINAQNKKWLDLITKKDAAGVAQIYTDDGAIFPPNSPKAAGRASLQTFWGEFFKIPGMSLTFKTEKLVFSADHTMATDIGTYEAGFGEGANRVIDKGKSVVVWVKRDGNWLVLTDMFSSDAPPPAPQPQAAAAPEQPQMLTQELPSPEPALAITAADPALQWSPCPPIFPAPCQLTVLHGNPANDNADAFLRVPSQYEIPPHFHTSAERMILVTGELVVTYRGQDAVSLKVGTYAYGPARSPHKAKCISADPCTLFIAFETPVDAFAYEGTLP